MIIPGFTFASFMIVMNEEPRFQGVGIEKCKQIMTSYPNGLSEKEVDSMLGPDHKKLGSVFFRRDSVLFMMDVEEKRVVLKHMETNEYDISRFCGTYFDLRDRVKKIGGEFEDERFPGSP